MSEITFHRVQSLPDTLEPDSLYFVREEQGQAAVLYVTDSQANAVPLTSVEARWLVGDSDTGVPTQRSGTRVRYVRTIQTSGNELVIPLTIDGTLSGDAIFANLAECHISYSLLRDTDENDEAPWAYLKQVDTVDHKSFTLKLKRSETGVVVLGGSYSGSEDNDLEVFVHISVEGVVADVV